MILQKPVENLVFDFLDKAISEAKPVSILRGIELHDTVHQTIVTNSGIRIGDAKSTLSPNGDGNLKEFDAVLEIICYSRVETDEKRERLAARNKVFNLGAAVTQLFIDDPSMNGSGCDVLVISITRGYVDTDADSYAVAIIDIVVNPSGAINFTRRS